MATDHQREKISIIDLTDDSLHDSTSPNNKDLTNDSLHEFTSPNSKDKKIVPYVEKKLSNNVTGTHCPDLSDNKDSFN